MAKTETWKPKSIRGMPLEEYFVHGHLACASCGPAIIMRLISKAAGPNTIVVNATGCMEVVSSKYPTTAWNLPWVHGAFENAAPIASGVHASLTMQGIRDKYNILVIGGDGATYDIGFGALSAALERGDKFTYICYDNESYANTGNQRSGATPWKSWSTTTPVGKKIKGKQVEKKPITEIIAAHNIPYIATASLSHPEDLFKKVKKSFTFEGPAFINIIAPCILGWKYRPGMPVELSRRAVDSGLWLLYEIEHGEFTLNYEPKMTPVEDYLKEQGRFKHLTKEDIQHISQQVQHNYTEMKKYLTAMKSETSKQKRSEKNGSQIQKTSNRTN